MSPPERGLGEEILIIVNNINKTEQSSQVKPGIICYSNNFNGLALVRLLVEGNAFGEPGKGANGYF